MHHSGLNLGSNIDDIWRNQTHEHTQQIRIMNLLSSTWVIVLSGKNKSHNAWECLVNKV